MNPIVTITRSAAPSVVVLAALALSSLLLGNYAQVLLTRILIFAIFAMSLDLLVGYVGLPSLGHAAFFGVGGYAVGLVTLNWTNNLVVGLIATSLASVAAGLVFGLIALRARLIYFMMLTLALAQVVWGIAHDADTVMIGLPFADALRFAQQYPDYAPDPKLQMTSVGGGSTTPVNVAQLKDKVVGYVGFEAYCTCIPSQMNQDFIQQWTSAYPGRAVTADAAQGYSAAQILEAALAKVEAIGQNTQALLDALHATNLETVKGPISFDADGDVVQNVYVYKVIKTSSGVDYQLIETYPSLTPGWDRSAQELATFPFGKLKGKWVGMTAEELAKIAAP